MDMEQEDMQYLGFFGVCREAYKIIHSWRKVFSQITLALVLPLSFILLAHMEVSEVLFSKIIHNEMVLGETKTGTPRYQKLSDVLRSELITLWLFKAVYLIFSLIFSLLSTSAVVYTIACIYTGREVVTFEKVMSVVPKVWKRLMLTFLCTFVAYLAYNIVAALILVASGAFIISINIKYLSLLYVLVVFYILGFVYLSIVWQLANAVTVLEDTWGFHALRKSRALLKGKMWVATFILLLVNLCHFAIQISFEKLVVRGGSLGAASRFAYGIICLVLLFMLLLSGLVLRTVIYFVCKSYHHENIDKSALSDHLAGYYIGEYVPLKSKDVQLEHLYV
ncbi:hypothetical protein I3843_15G022600 [Carya illinoinensis]|uniref:Uncharacterized protein n=1 Tax=Carya illinoinensis TaxID=32201 RepID=A0A8T1N724_CARIL|nr:uncharacterized protein LOC122296104 [Carya illinoinensis]KAG2665744.1 hypothetical protein I3760_15G023500 [Carya illinoinensis]KAG6626095.1 hypothetical protein CIPAW_15G023500 [Carya illinoinensis]KAG6674072.1 hypothetical protein I3842_15G024300 [Carya illinoinensis]KAG7943093.1 hypothetical protein I3843_15G022600 [Carya illinoinensis]